MCFDNLVYYTYPGGSIDVLFFLNLPVFALAFFQRLMLSNFIKSFIIDRNE